MENQVIPETFGLIPLTQGKFAIVDSCDYERISGWSWFARWSPMTCSYYAMRGPGLSMHRVILGLKPGDKLQIDHINKDTLDNRRQNIRIATASQNGANRGKNSNNTSGYKGVSFHRASGKWRSQVRVNRIQKNLGLFDSAEDAFRAYCSAAKIHFEEFCRTES
jgi:hypothetical protein